MKVRFDAKLCKSTGVHKVGMPHENQRKLRDC
jgi:hypothetical protein